MNYLKSIREWSAQFTSPFAEALKEAFRITLFSIPAELITALQTEKIDMRILAINISIIFLRALDKYLHEKGKEEKGYNVGKAESSGISPI